MTAVPNDAPARSEPQGARRGGPRWARPALPGLLAATGLLYVWGLGASGWANPYYSAAVQAATESWTAFFFGASDAAGAITVDKTPAALWPMALSARIFGLSSWSILVPQALMGVATVAVVYATVRRRFPAWAALVAGAAMALTPVAVLMFRFNNPDALLVLLLTVAAYCVVRAQERGATRWLVLAGAALGWAFLAKMLQAFLVLPGFALVYLLTAPVTLRRRLWQLMLAGAALAASAGWWLLIVALVPAGSRPYIGGSQTNSVLELALGYNGIGRLNGANYGGLGNTDQQAGWLRLFDTELGGQVSWLLPAALILLAAGLWATRRAPRTDPARAAFGVWGTWLLVTGLIFSLMRGIFHAYYTVALAPAVAALVGMGAAVLWRRRREPAAAVTLAVAAAVTGWWAWVLLGRTPGWNAWLGPVALAAALVLAGAILAARVLPARFLALAGALAVVVSLAGPAAYALDTAASPHTGAIPSAGPAMGGGFGGMRAVGPRDGFGGPRDGRPAGPPQGMGRGGGFGGMGGGGGLLNATTPSAELTALLQRGAAGHTWAAATVGSNNAAGYQLASGEPVMAVGGFNGTDPAPTLERFQRYVAAGEIHYFLGGGMGMGRGGAVEGGSDEAARIAEWVRQNFAARTVGGVTVYDLSTGESPAATA